MRRTLVDGRGLADFGDTTEVRHRHPVSTMTYDRQVVCDDPTATPRRCWRSRNRLMTGGHDPFWGSFADGPDEVVKAVRQPVFAGPT